MQEQFFLISQIILGVLLIGLILMQAKGSGLGSTFGSDMALYRTRRGVEKSVFYLSLMVAGLFIISSIFRIII